MSEAHRLDVLQEALFAFAVTLHDHGPACVCAACQACQGALALYPRLAHLLAILDEWSRGEVLEGEDDSFTVEDIGIALSVLDEGSTVRVHQAPPPRAGEGEGEKTP